MDRFESQAFFVGRVKEIMRLHKKKTLTDKKALERIEKAVNEIKGDKE